MYDIYVNNYQHSLRPLKYWRHWLIIKNKLYEWPDN